MIGQIVFYVPKRGFGFIRSTGGEKFFFHISSWTGKEIPEVNQNGQSERAKPVSSEGKNDSAVDVTPIEQASVQKSDLDILAGRGAL